jgi:curved DNA-binding protein CbpA
MAIDPYRTLGLEPGASSAEIKRAYRRLAKAFHPDSAGEGALPRFLAIHEAYDALTTGRRGARGGSAAPAGGSGASAEPWRADPARARAARERARTRGTRSGPSAGGARPASGPGTAERGAGARTAGRHGGDPTGGAPRTGASGPAGGTAGPAGGSQTRGGRRRTTRKATLGSTSYDEARDPADPTWGGAAWYGPTSGEYWTVNPREYADPRKHGPEYQSRAWRGSTTATGAWPEEETAAGQGAAAAGSPSAANGTSAARTASARARSRGTDRAWTPPAHDGSAPDRPIMPPSTRPIGPPLESIVGADLGDPTRRLGFALLAWAPLGVAAAALIGRVTGCSVYSASCGPTEPLLPWLAQAAILGILLLVPALSRILSVGTLALLLALLPLAGFFVALGGAGQAEGAVAFVVLLALAWAAGVGAAILTTWRLRAPGRLP